MNNSILKVAEEYWLATRSVRLYGTKGLISLFLSGVSFIYLLYYLHPYAKAVLSTGQLAMVIFIEFLSASFLYLASYQHAMNSIRKMMGHNAPIKVDLFKISEHYNDARENYISGLLDEHSVLPCDVIQVLNISDKTREMFKSFDFDVSVSNVGRFIYSSDAKNRIIALSSALVALVSAIIFKGMPNNLIQQFVLNINSILKLYWIVLILLAASIIIFLMLLAIMKEVAIKSLPFSKNIMGNLAVDLVKISNPRFLVFHPF